MLILDVMQVLMPVKNLVVAVAKDFSLFNVADKSAALAYRALFALVPILILIAYVAGLYNLGWLAISGIEEFFGRYFGTQSAIFVENVTEVAASSVGVTAAIVGFLLMAYGAVGFFLTIQRSFFAIFSVSIDKKSLIKNVLYTYIYSVVYLIIFLFFITALFIARFFLVSGIEFLEELVAYNLSPTTIRALTAVLMLALLTSFLGVSYRFFSRYTLSLVDAMIGGFTASILILALNNLLSLYFSFSSVLSLYGAAAFLVTILLWVYFFSMILFIGALVARGVSKV